MRYLINLLKKPATICCVYRKPYAEWVAKPYTKHTEEHRQTGPAVDPRMVTIGKSALRFQFCVQCEYGK